MLIFQLLFILFLGLLDAQMLSPLLPALAREFSVDPANMGTVVTAYAFAAAVCALIIGPLSDRWGRTSFLRAAALLLGLTSVLAGLAPRFEIYFAARLLAGLAGGTISACVLAQIADSFTFQRRGRAMGWVGAIYSLAAVLGVPAAAWIAGQWSWRVIYAAMAVFAIVLGLFLRQRTVPPRETTSARQIFADYAHFWKKSQTRHGLLLAATISAAAAALLTYLGIYLSETFGLSITAIGFVFLAAGAASTLGALGGGVLSDRFGKQRMITLTSFMLVLILPALTLARSTLQLYAVVAAAGLVLAAREGPYQALISALVPASQRGAYIAVRNAASQIAIAASVAAAAWLYHRSGFEAVTLYAAALSLASAFLVWLIKEPARELNPSKPSPTNLSKS